MALEFLLRFRAEFYSDLIRRHNLHVWNYLSNNKKYIRYKIINFG